MYLCTGVSGAALSLLTWSRAVSSVNAESISTNCVLGIGDFFGLKVTQEWVGGGALWQECGDCREGGLITCFTHRAEIQHLLYWVTERAGEGGRREATQNFNIFKQQQTVLFGQTFQKKSQTQPQLSRTPTNQSKQSFITEEALSWKETKCIIWAVG